MLHTILLCSVQSFIPLWTQILPSFKLFESSLSLVHSVPVRPVRFTVPSGKDGAKSSSMAVSWPSMPWATRSNVHYFAIGSNMNPAVLRGMRRVDPLEENPGFVKGYRLAFNMMGTPGIEPSFASAEISADPNDELHGVLYNLTWSDWARVAATEGVPIGYSAVTVKVILYDGRTVDAVTLSAGPWSRTPFNIDIRPSARYRELLIEGARIHNVSEAYCRKLEKIDPNPFILIDTRIAYSRRRRDRGW